MPRGTLNNQIHVAEPLNHTLTVDSKASAVSAHQEPTVDYHTIFLCAASTVILVTFLCIGFIGGRLSHTRKNRNTRILSLSQMSPQDFEGRKSSSLSDAPHSITYSTPVLESRAFSQQQQWTARTFTPSDRYLQKGRPSTSTTREMNHLGTMPECLRKNLGENLYRLRAAGHRELEDSSSLNSPMDAVLDTTEIGQHHRLAQVEEDSIPTSQLSARSDFTLDIPYSAAQTGSVGVNSKSTDTTSSDLKVGSSQTSRAESSIYMGVLAYNGDLAG
ncbi:hypothetical protein HDU81_009689 [Chytriomyces hyalinus]|nr:hypothetical protein HDU81_009689 [Chytriomyces hyalinus]